MRHTHPNQNAVHLNALHWGIKAAQAGLSLASNPYRSAQTRAAWEAGYRQMTRSDQLAA
jgi:ribosome modulation factor